MKNTIVGCRSYKNENNEKIFVCNGINKCESKNEIDFKLNSPICDSCFSFLQKYLTIKSYNNEFGILNIPLKTIGKININVVLSRQYFLQNIFNCYPNLETYDAQKIMLHNLDLRLFSQIGYTFKDLDHIVHRVKNNYYKFITEPKRLWAIEHGPRGSNAIRIHQLSNPEALTVLINLAKYVRKVDVDHIDIQKTLIQLLCDMEPPRYIDWTTWDTSTE